MILGDLGYKPILEDYRQENKLAAFGIGRVVSEHKERYIVKTVVKECEAEIIGNLRYTAQSRADFPAVGDWVAISDYDEDKVLIHHVFPRSTTIERTAVGRHGEKQIIATNIDVAFIVQAVDRDFNVNRIERYMTICNAAHVRAVIILNKIDLISETELNNLITQVQDRIKKVPVIAISNESKKGIDGLRELIHKGKTYCLLGSSGVGKSSLINNLSEKEAMITNTISSSTSKGRHVTSHRELLVLENGGIIIDNPGMREVGIADASVGLEITFEAIMQLSQDCKFKDCTHTSEVGCAVLAGVESGAIDPSSYDNYLRMEREKEHFESTVAERRKRDKGFGKMIKQIKKDRKKNKF